MDFVTGGTGLLGSHVLLALTERHRKIRAIYCDYERVKHIHQLFLLIDPIHGEQRWDLIEWVKGDILDIQSLQEHIEKKDDVYHCAGLVSFDPQRFHQVMKINREGTANVVNVCLEKGIRKMCHVSSTAAIGGQPNTLTTEETHWKDDEGNSGYAYSKYAAEREVWRGIEEGLTAVIVNPSVLFGAGNWDESSMTMFRTVENGLPFYTSGQNAFVDARDVAEIMLRLMESEIESQRYLCIAENLPFKHILSQIAEGISKKSPHISTPKWLTGIAWRLSWFVSRLRGHSPTITRETAVSAYRTMSYSNEKVRKALSVNFRPMAETIEYATCYRLKK
jgi:nucleoside-diphosphate-sugar epimerase